MKCYLTVVTIMWLLAKLKRWLFPGPTLEGMQCHFGVSGIMGLFLELIRAEAAFIGIMPRCRVDEQNIAAFMQSVARRQPGRHLALDVGTREGYSSRPYSQAGWRVISLDIAVRGLRSGLRSGRIQPGRAVVADGRRLPFRDAAFDLVSSRWFLHENPDQQAFLSEMKRVVQEQGSIVAVDFAAPDRASQAYLNRHILPDEHVRTRSEFAGPWGDAGLALKSIKWRIMQVQRDDKIRKAVCGPEGNVPGGVRKVLHIKCDDNSLFLDIPVAFLVARKIASAPSARKIWGR